VTLDLPAGWPEVLAAIVAGPGAWASVAVIAERIKLGESVADKRCEALLEAGWLSTFEWEGAKVYTLSDTAAMTLGCRLEPDQWDKGERWVERGKGARVQARHRAEVEFERLPGGLGVLVPDPQPEPAQAVEWTELVEQWIFESRYLGRKVSIDEAPWPVICLTGSDTVWREWGYSPRGCNYRLRDGTWIGRREARCVRYNAKPLRPVSCSCCRLSRLPRNTVCLRCARWGWDDYFAELGRERRGA